jgi:general secretion pathway protein H
MDSGYTLVELLVVLAIAALLVALAVPFSAESLARAELVSDARHVATELRKLEALAVSTNSDVTIMQSKTALMIVDGQPAVSSHIDSTVQIAGPEPISFYPDGTSGGGRLLVSRDGETIAIGVEWLTGRIEIGGAQ